MTYERITGRLIVELEILVERVMTNSTPQSALMAPYFPFDDNTAGEPLEGVKV